MSSIITSPSSAQYEIEGRKERVGSEIGDVSCEIDVF